MSWISTTNVHNVKRLVVMHDYLEKEKKFTTRLVLHLEGEPSEDCVIVTAYSDAQLDVDDIKPPITWKP